MTDTSPQDIPAQVQEQGEASVKEKKIGGDTRTQEEIERDDALALRLSSIIEDANKQVVPMCTMIRKVGPARH
jgi:hypothetical protein